MMSLGFAFINWKFVRSCPWVTQSVQYVARNNVARCCFEILRAFGRALMVYAVDSALCKP